MITDNYQADIAILGGGVACCIAAMALAPIYTVVFIDQLNGLRTSVQVIQFSKTPTNIKWTRYGIIILSINTFFTAMKSAGKKMFFGQGELRDSKKPLLDKAIPPVSKHHR